MKNSPVFPKNQFMGGIYVNDNFFNNNLYLQAGFEYQNWGVTKWYKPYLQVQLAFEPGDKLDFTLAGEIKKTCHFLFHLGKFIR